MLWEHVDKDKDDALDFEEGEKVLGLEEDPVADDRSMSQSGTSTTNTAEEYFQAILHTARA